jgi:energy-coupling factor transporter ATP-binding protein EcfA2
MNGSIWQKWDLHVHTPDSIVNSFSFLDETEREQYHEDIWEKYIEKLEEIKDISVIGITDYFSLSGYKKIQEYRNKGRLKNFQLILPNIEFRLDVLAGKENKRINYHILFSENLDPEIIEREFLKELHIKSPNSEKRILSQDSILEIGKEIKQQHADFHQKSDLVAGFDVITVHLQEILKVLNGKQSIFNGKYILVLSAPIWDEISWDGQGHIERKALFIKSHALFSSQKSTIEFCLGKNCVDPAQFLEEFGSFKPCIHGSDAHSFDKLCRPDKDRYCWIKAMPTFDGLKQIIYEPEERVRIQEKDPESYKNVYSLKSVAFFDSDITDGLTIVPQTINFNKNFVAITGGKGSGKTAILDLIANCYVDRCKRIGYDEGNGVDKNSFVQRIQEETDKLGVEIEFIGESIDPFSKRILDSTYIEKSPITYLPQGKIEEISGDRIKLNEKIEEIVFNNEKVKKEGYIERYTVIKEKTKAISRQLNEYNLKISKLESETTKEIFAELNNEKEKANGKLTDIKNQINQIEVNLEEGIKDKISNLKKEIKKAKTDHIKCSDLLKNIEILKGGIYSFALSSNKNIEDINKNVSNFEIDLQIPSVDVNEQIFAIDSIIASLSELKIKLNQEYLVKEKSLLEISGEEKIHTKLIKDVEIIEGVIKKGDESITTFNNKKAEITQFEQQRITEFENLLIAFSEWEKYYNEVIDAFSIGKSEILGDIQFKSKILFDYEKFSSFADDIFHKKKVSQEFIDNHVKILNQQLDHYFQDSGSFDNVKTVIETFFNLRESIKKTRSFKEFYDWLFGNYFSLNTEIEFRSTPIDRLSMGQKGTVLLKLFLAEGDYPIILDQPEENLDNKFIYNELVGAMRNAKLNRQVLIATNNANLVVNTDAEQIIIAEFIGGKITYKSGALESSDIREEIMPLLEGGQEAFKKREQKYGILGYQV